MNKQDKLVFAELQTTITRIRALHCSGDKPAPDLAPERGSRDPITGWSYNLFRYESPSDIDTAVFQAWATAYYHGEGPYLGTNGLMVRKSNIMQLYSTRKRALQALRCDVEANAADLLGGIDKALQDED